MNMEEKRFIVEQYNSANPVEIIAALKEENNKNEPLELNGEQFRLIYRYLKRVGSSNYMSGSQLLIFTFCDTETNEDIPGEVIYGFLSVLCKYLRASDVFTKHGDSQVLVMLYDITNSDSEMVIERIEHEWEQNSSDYKRYSVETHTEWLR
jgi:hypothetical protein